VVPC